MGASAWDARGPTPTDVLLYIHDRGPLAIASDFARAHAADVAALASAGYITSLAVSGGATRQWRLTLNGQWLVNTSEYTQCP
jgi:hypothetical protein